MNPLSPERVLDPAHHAAALAVAVPDALRHGADAGGRIKVVGEPEEITTAQLVQDVERLAAGLVDAGLQPGERVGVWLPSSTELLRWAYAVMFAGGSTVFLSTRSPLAEILGHARRAGARWVIGHEASGEEVQKPGEARRRFGSPAAGTTLPQVQPDWEAGCFTTSGSTGVAKLATHAHRAFSSQIISIQIACGGPADETVLFPLPMTHVAFLGNVHAFLAQGRRFVALPEFDATKVINLLRDERATWLIGTPAIWELLMRRATLPDPTLSMRRVNYGGGPMTPDRARALGEAFRAEVGHTYGSTETGGYSVFLGPDLAVEKAGSCGRLLPPYTGLSMRDPATGEEVATGEVGEICLQGPSITTGYIGMPDETAGLLAGGWCHTGDLGRTDADGISWVTGRIKDQINRGGLKIGAREVEEVLEAMPGITGAKVVGLPDPVLGERVAAVVEGDVTEAAVRAFVAERLADYKVPETVLSVAELPRNAMAKPDRPAIVALLRP